MNMTAALPNELWQRIFRFAALSSDSEETVHGWVHLWPVCRQVSRQWRANIARAYFDLLLMYPKRCVIHFECDWDWVPDMEGCSRCIFEVEMFYDRVEQDNKRRVVFKEAADSVGVFPRGDEEFEKVYAEKKYGIWERKIKEYLGPNPDTRKEGGRFDLTPYVISLYGAALDTELPELRYDVKAKEISFEWEGMLNAFCIEYAELDKRNRSMSPDLVAAAHNADTSPSDDLLATTMAGFKAIEHNMTANVKDVRRHRILKFYREKELDYEVKFDVMDEDYEKEQLRRIDRAAGLGADKSDADMFDIDDHFESYDEEDLDEDGDDDNDDDEDLETESDEE